MAIMIRIPWFSLALVALASGGCDTSTIKTESAVKGQEIEVTITATGDLCTRTEIYKDSEDYKLRWSAEDKLGVWGFRTSDGATLGANSLFTIADIDGENGAAHFTGTLSDIADGAAINARYYACYPYSASDPATTASADKLSLTLSIPAIQYPSLTSFDGAADLLVGYPVTTTAPVGKLSGGSDLGFAFLRVGAAAEFSVKGIPSEITAEDYVKQVTLDFGSAVTGDVLVELTDSDPVVKGLGTTVSNAVTLDYTGKNVALNEDFTMWWQMMPSQVGSIELTIETDLYTIEKSLIPTNPLDFVQNKVNRSTVDLSTAIVTAKLEPFTPFTVDFQESEFLISGTFDTKVKLDGPTGRKWRMLSGTVSTNSAINGGKSLQMRFQKSNPNIIPYAYTDFDLVGLRSVSFWATGGTTNGGEELRLDYSTDGGESWVEGQSFTLTATAKEYSHILPATVLATDAVRIRFTTTDTAPTGSSAPSFRRYVIDDVAFSNE
jgi:hypothetical protein